MKYVEHLFEYKERSDLGVRGGEYIFGGFQQLPRNMPIPESALGRGGLLRCFATGGSWLNFLIH